MNKSIIPLSFVGFGLYFFSKKEKSNKRQQLVDYIQNSNDSQQDKDATSELFLTMMTDTEINAVHTFIVEYSQKGLRLPEGDLKNQISAISNKYNIFT